MTSRKKPGVAFWATVVLVVALLVAYPLMWGPWWYASARWGNEAWAVRMSRPAFMPVRIAVDWLPTWLTERYGSYLADCVMAGKRDRNR